MDQQADCIDKSVYDELKNMMKSKPEMVKSSLNR